jgi:hypothetical protein
MDIPAQLGSCRMETDAVEKRRGMRRRKRKEKEKTEREE